MVGFSTWTGGIQFSGWFLCFPQMGHTVTCRMAFSVCSGRATVGTFGALCELGKKKVSPLQLLLGSVAWEQAVCLWERRAFFCPAVPGPGTWLGTCATCWRSAPLSCLAEHPCGSATCTVLGTEATILEECNPSAKYGTSPCGYRVNFPLSGRVAFYLQSEIEMSLRFCVSCL